MAIQDILVSGGWADVAIEQDPGFGVLIAVDPQPGVKGDAYWIRIAWADLARQASISELDAAKARWATAQLTDYSYTWEYRGDGDPLTYKVARKGAEAAVTPVGNTPAPEARAYAAPRIEDTFAMIEASSPRAARSTRPTTTSSATPSASRCTPMATPARMAWSRSGRSSAADAGRCGRPPAGAARRAHPTAPSAAVRRDDAVPPSPSP